MIEERTRRDIDNRVERLLRDINALEPPLNLADVLDHLNLHKNYFTLDDPGLIREFEHRIRIGAAVGISKIKKIFKKISIKAMTFPEERKILIDGSIPDPKKRWAESHEICHNLIPTHRYFLIGDVYETLDPDYQEMLEAEANYGASALIFLGRAFSKESLDLSIDWNTISYLRKRFGNSITSTLRRYILFSDNSPKIGFVHTPSWMVKPDDQVTRCRHFIRSKKFESEFSKISSTDILEIVENYISPRKGGPVGESTFEIRDDNGQTHEFVGYSFFNQYYILTLIAYVKPASPFF